MERNSTILCKANEKTSQPDPTPKLLTDCFMYTSLFVYNLRPKYERNRIDWRWRGYSSSCSNRVLKCDVTKIVFQTFWTSLPLSKSTREKMNYVENLTKIEQKPVEIWAVECENFAIHFSYISWKCEPTLKLQKMYGEIFTLNGSYLCEYLLNFCQIFTIFFLKFFLDVVTKCKKIAKNIFVMSSLEDSIYFA